nr:HlyD family efflux transporter periplasmic adaptor subunit [uncultured Anaerobutyricum sp.]
MEKKTKGKLHLHINLGTIVFLIIVIYLMAYVLTYLGKSKLAIYEVSASNIVDSMEGTGVALRKETLVNTNRKGYINYYVQDGSMVSKNGIVYTIDTTGKVQNYLKGVLQKKSKVSRTEKERVVEQLKVFSEGYTDNEFSSLYEAQRDISGTLMAYTDTILANNKEQLTEKYGQDSYITVTSPKEGIVSFASDGLEGLEQKKVSKDTFINKVKMKELRTDKKQSAGSPVYRLVEGQDWQLMISLGHNDYNRLKKREEDSSTVQVTFHKDNFTTATKYHCIKQDGRYYVVLSFDNYIQRYLNQRYLYVTLTLSETEGLKIPSSSLVKKNVYKIPKSFLVNGGNSSKKNQINIMNTNKKGERVLSQTTVDIYKTDEKYAYVSSKDLKKGIVVSETDKQKIYTLKNITQIQGVYIVNRGYTVFKQVVMVERNEDYCIVDAQNSGIELYDRIILNSDTVKEDQVIY